MPQLSDCIRWLKIGSPSGGKTTLQVKRNGAWVDVRIEEPHVIREEPLSDIDAQLLARRGRTVREEDNAPK